MRRPRSGEANLPDRVRTSVPSSHDDLPNEVKRGSTAPQETFGLRLQKGAADVGVVIALVAMIIGFSIWLPQTFPTWANARVILGDHAVPGILALAVLLPLVGGEFDLSVGATLGFASVLSAYCASKGVPVGIILMLSIGAGAAIGAANAFFVRVGVNAFIATLGMATVLSGGNLVLTKGSTIFQGIGPSFTRLTQTHLLGLTLPVFYFLGLALLLFYLLEWTPYGRYIRATGLGRNAARLTGVRTQFWLGSAFVGAAALAAFAGFVETGTAISAPPTIGPEYLLPAYAAAFLGSTTVRPGFFNVWGTVAGVFLLAVGTSGLALAGAPYWVEPFFNGTTLLIAVTAAVLIGRRSGTATGA
jgi:ribose transport system permease protein